MAAVAQAHAVASLTAPGPPVAAVAQAHAVASLTGVGLLLPLVLQPGV